MIDAGLGIGKTCPRITLMNANERAETVDAESVECHHHSFAPISIIREQRRLTFDSLLAKILEIA